jgi:hypothetical protein
VGVLPGKRQALACLHVGGRIGAQRRVDVQPQSVRQVHRRGRTEIFHRAGNGPDVAGKFWADAVAE